jgi:hypothetical protein
MIETVSLARNTFEVLRTLDDAFADQDAKRRLSAYMNAQRGKAYRRFLRILIPEMDNSAQDVCSDRDRAELSRLQSKLAEWEKGSYTLFDVATNHVIDGTHRLAIRVAAGLPVRLKMVKLLSNGVTEKEFNGS